jgi:hypothetical protein
MTSKLMDHKSKDLKKHICWLSAQGLEGCIEQLSDRPLVECIYCGAKANSLRNICAAHLIDNTSKEKT